jgi:hypothetical protein
VVGRVRTRDVPEERRVLSTTAIVVWAAGLLVVAVGSVALLWIALGSGDPRDTGRLDTIRTASSIVVGTGGAAALLLAARRQRSTELDLRQKDVDATERRVTELYGKAADQLGSPNAPVRFAGLYALERLAQGNPEHRQTIVNLLCAYLRMPFEPPSALPARGLRGPRRGGAEAAQELEVRLAAQSVLATHLRPGDDEDEPSDSFWSGMDVKLSGATLVNFRLARCSLRSVAFPGAVFVGAAVFRGLTVTGTSDFRDTRFTGHADLRRVALGKDGGAFRGTAFEGGVDFGTTTTASLTGARTRTDAGVRRKWPDGWVEQPEAGRRGWATLVSGDSPTPEAGAEIGPRSSGRNGPVPLTVPVTVETDGRRRR